MASLQQQEERFAYKLLLPSILVVGGIIFFPLLYNIWLSVHKVGLMDLGTARPFVFLDNIIRVFHHEDFWPSLQVTFIYSIGSTVLSMLAGLGAALLLNRAFPFKGIVRGMFLLPYVTPIISLAFIWVWLLNPMYGVINYLLMQVGFISQPRAWVSEPGIALMTIILFEAWRYFPFAMLLLLARLQAVPDELYEAGEVDGTNAWQKFWFITLPELGQTLGVVALLRFMWAFNKFEDVFLLTRGAVGTKTLPVLVYDYAFGSNDLGMAAATAMVLFLILISVLPFYIRRVLKWG